MEERCCFSTLSGAHIREHAPCSQNTIRRTRGVEFSQQRAAALLSRRISIKLFGRKREECSCIFARVSRCNYPIIRVSNLDPTCILKEFVSRTTSCSSNFSEATSISRSYNFGIADIRVGIPMTKSRKSIVLVSPQLAVTSLPIA